jgi:hypothetical protein
MAIPGVFWYVSSSLRNATLVILSASLICPYDPIHGIGLGISSGTENHTVTGATMDLRGTNMKEEKIPGERIVFPAGSNIVEATVYAS